MGTDVHVVLTGGTRSLLENGLELIDELEQRWSRFLDDSEISRLNRLPGVPVVVSPDTFLLFERAISAWRATGGSFDPTVGAALEAFGYHRDFNELTGTVAASPSSAGPVPGCGSVSLDPLLRAVTLPVGVRFDPGGVGKGLAADLVAQRLVDAGAAGALVNLGGDLRAIGAPPDTDGWVVGVADPGDPNLELFRIGLRGGAVATSSSLKRRWITTSGEAHHLIDPTTGQPAVSDVVGVTVIAQEAWWADAVTKALYFGGPEALGRYPHTHAVIVTGDGRRYATSGLEGFIR